MDFQGYLFLCSKLMNLNFRKLWNSNFSRKFLSLSSTWQFFTIWGQNPTGICQFKAVYSTVQAKSASQ